MERFSRRGSGGRLQELVELGLRLRETHGQQHAAKLMAKWQVPETVIARVLCEPTWRRRTTVRD